MRGTHDVLRDPDDPASWYLRAADGGGRYRLTAHEVENDRGDTLVVDRSAGSVLLADPFTGRVEAGATFVTANVCRPPASVTRYADVGHYALDGPGDGRLEYHLGRNPESALGFVLSPDGRRLGRIETSAATASVRVDVDLDWRSVLAAVHVTLFPTEPKRRWGRISSRRRRRSR